MGHRRFVPIATLLAAGALANCTPPSRRQPQPPPNEPVYAPPPSLPPAPLPPPPVLAQPDTPRPVPTFRVPPPRPMPSTTASAKPAPPPPVTAPPVASAPPPPPPGCGSVDVDGVVVPLDCWTKDYAKLDQASKTSMRQAFSSAGAPPPDYVDHRRDKVEGPVRHQQRVGAGAAFALAGAIDQALVRAGSAGASVSVQQLWGRSPRANFGAIASASLGRGVAAESTLAYDEALACTWGDNDAARLCRASDKGRAPRADELAKAEQTPLARLVDVVEIDGTNGDALREAIAKNQDVLAVLRVEPDAWKSVVKAPDAEPLLADYLGMAAVQAVTIVGYAKQDGAFYFLLKNSWGPHWGAGGYAWIAEKTLKRNVVEAYLVQATPANAPDIAPPPTCPEGQVPDAGTKACAPACSDKSPRTNGVCPDAKKGGCAPGFVNVTGHCVVAAPDKTGSDPQTGLAFACGAAGCTYTWKKGTLGCTQTACSQSCPAPKFLAAVNVAKKTITCTE